MKIFPQKNPFSEEIIEIFMFLLKSAFVIFSFLILMAVIDSDFMQRIKHQTYGNCVKKLSTEYALPIIDHDEQGAVIQYDESEIIDPKAAAEHSCAQLFEVE